MTQPAQSHLARARAYRLSGNTDSAASEYRLALDHDPDLLEAYVGLSELRMPGDGYRRWLKRLHGALAPETYLEIGIARGGTFALARPPTIAVGIDPAPRISAPLTANSSIFRETSDAFFRSRNLETILAGRPLALAFIDGLHQFQQVLKDFINVEAYCGRRSVVLMHDTIPFDERTQRPEREAPFYTGDVWKVVPCLKHYRPDLDIFTIATPWSGLTVVTGLDPHSQILRDNYEAAVGRFAHLSFFDVESNIMEVINAVPNDWHLVQQRLAECGAIVAGKEMATRTSPV